MLLSFSTIILLLRSTQASAPKSILGQAPYLPWAKINLLRPQRNPGNGYHCFTEQDIKRLEFIKIDSIKLQILSPSGIPRHFAKASSKFYQLC
jgi:hypothetical protein